MSAERWSGDFHPPVMRCDLVGQETERADQGSWHKLIVSPLPVTNLIGSDHDALCCLVSVLGLVASNSGMYMQSSRAAW